MARPRAYKHGIRCPECGSNWMPRKGTSQGRQVYRCGDCDRYYIHGLLTPAPAPPTGNRPGPCMKEAFLWSAIARIVGVTPPAVRREVKKGCIPGCEASRTAGVG